MPLWVSFYLQGAAKVSIIMIGQQAIMDAYLCLLHLTAGILVGKFKICWCCVSLLISLELVKCAIWKILLLYTRGKFCTYYVVLGNKPQLVIPYQSPLRPVWYVGTLYSATDITEKIYKLVLALNTLYYVLLMVW